MNFVDKDKNQTTAMILIGIGALALLGTLGVFSFIGDLLGAVLFGGLAYFAYVEGRRRNSITWRLAAFPLAGLAIASIAPWRLGSGAFLASLGLAFAVYWYEDRTRWWALIPAGTLATLGLVAFFEAVFGPSIGWLFLVGLALTFYALTRLEVEPQPWAIWPAAGLGIIALLSIVEGSGWLVPALLIGAGAYLLMRRGDLSGFGSPRGRNDRDPAGRSYHDPAGRNDHDPAMTTSTGSPVQQQPHQVAPPAQPAPPAPPADDGNGVS